MFPIMPSTKIAQIVLLHWTRGPPELYIRLFLMTSPEQMVQIQNNTQNCSSWHLPKLHKWFLSAEQRGSQSSR